jgi:mRNA-degrading endonuclease HigB of HigAB toxin-antitoxin module
MIKKYFAIFITMICSEMAFSQTLSTAPTLTFTNNTGIGADNIATDGDGGSVNITDIDINIYNISDVNGTMVTPLSWESSSFYASGTYTGITKNDGNALIGTKGMLIKSANGNEFDLNQFDYLNWGENFAITNTIKGYRNGVEVASSTFQGYSLAYIATTIVLSSAFDNVDEVRFYISSIGYITDGSSTNHSINSIKVSTAVVPNSAPTDLALSASAINENVVANATVGALSTTDPDVANTFTYTLVAGTGSTDNVSFNISGNNLRITASPDFETKSSYSVRVRTTDQGSLFFEKQFIININNLNESPTDLALSASAINENVLANATVGSLSTTDPDVANTFTYTLVAGTGSTDNASFNISGNSLRITASPDFETKSSYSVRVRTTDQGSLFFEKQFTITINNLNESPTDLILSASAINENVVANATVGSLSSTDPDVANTFTYTLVAGTGSTDNVSFNISGNSLRITASPDFETKSSYSVRVRTTDQGSLFFEKQFIININNLNESPTDLALSALAINENVLANATVGSLSTTDPDIANTFTYTLVAGTGSTDNVSFNISGNSLRITASPDFETKSSYSVRVRTTDQGSLFFEKQFTISINNLNEAPTDLALSASAINENVLANATVGALSTTDSDAANTFTYTLVAGTGSTDNASFNISGNSLRITTSPDFETKSSYSVRLRTTDQGSLFFEKQFTITINNLCDLNNAVTLSSGVLTATQTGATYKWYTCPSTLIPSATAQSYTPTVTGDYKVEITIGSCTVTSACTNVVVGTFANASFEKDETFVVYPNPNSGIVNIKSAVAGDYQLVNQLGQLLKTFKVEANVINTINIENMSDGIYFLKESKGTQTHQLILKK